MSLRPYLTRPLLNVFPVEPPLSLQAPSAMDLSGSTNSLDDLEPPTMSLDGITFDHFFEPSSCSSRLLQRSPTSRHRLEPSDGPPELTSRVKQWLGWSCSPLSDSIARVVRSPQSHAKPLPFPHRTPLMTPSRGIDHRALHMATPRTTLRGVPRTRPVTERQAFCELLKCVEMSARKKAPAKPGSVSPPRRRSQRQMALTPRTGGQSGFSPFLVTLPPRSTHEYKDAGDRRPTIVESRLLKLTVWHRAMSLQYEVRTC